ncbi:MAG: AAA family ATPase [Methylocapsa sp.]|nr:AAA family ATPase [Methylocapsa sp.]
MEEMSNASQEDVFAFLADPSAHGLSERVSRIDTHGAAVFLAGKDVYKVKRAVRYPFMDLSTLEKRKHACERELEVNRINAPDLYLGLVPISREGGQIKFGTANVIEWAVHLRRFDENRTLDRLASRGELDREIIVGLAQAAARSHKRAPIAAAANAASALHGQLEETLSSLAAAPHIFAREDVLELRKGLSRAYAQNEGLLKEREKKGQVRRCHGDLHLRNIALIDGEPVLFDAIEFDESIATCDVLYDLAFLLMDLWTRGLKREANLLFNRYLWICEGLESQLKGLALLPLFLSLRAAIRAKVAVLRPGGEENAIEARSFFAAARGFLLPAKLDLAAAGGLSGSGKTALAAAIAHSIGRAPGAVHLRSDIERKRIFGASEFERLPAEAYLPPVSARVYERLRSLAALALTAGHSVIIDAAHLLAEERRAVELAASQGKAHFTGLWLEATLGMLKERVRRRAKDASDATEEVVAKQAKLGASAAEWQRLDASAALDQIAAAARATLSR